MKDTVCNISIQPTEKKKIQIKNLTYFVDIVNYKQVDARKWFIVFNAYDPSCYIFDRVWPD